MDRNRIIGFSVLRTCSTSVVLVFLCLAFRGMGLAQTIPSSEVDEFFHRANAQYLESNYEEAVRLYQLIEAQGWESGELFFNLGNAYYRQGKVGAAILNYERARRFMPGDADVLRNLELANLKVVDKIEPLPEFLPLRWTKNLLQLLPSSSWLWLALGLYWITALLVTVWLLQDGTLLQRWLARTAFGTALSSILVFLLFAGNSWILGAEQPAIIMLAEVPARSAPGAGANEVFRIHEGTRVRMGKRSSEWTEIILADGKVGWIPSEALEII